MDYYRRLELLQKLERVVEKHCRKAGSVNERPCLALLQRMMAQGLQRMALEKVDESPGRLQKQACHPF